MNQKPLIRLESICKRFGTANVFDNFSHSIYAGKHQLITGPSGCGKTTLLKMMALLEPTNKGTIYYKGTDVTNKHGQPGIAQDITNLRIGYVSQDRDLWPHLTVQENILLALKVSGRDYSYNDTFFKIVGKLKLTDHLEKRPGDLSGGQQQRCAIARCLIHNPDIVFLDESFANLDEENIASAFEIIDAVVEQGATIVLVSHRTKLPTKLFSKIINLDTPKSTEGFCNA